MIGAANIGPKILKVSDDFQLGVVEKDLWLLDVDREDFGFRGRPFSTYAAEGGGGVPQKAYESVWG